MTLEDRLERLAGRTPPGDPTEIMAAARTRAQARTDIRSPRLLAAAAAAVVAVLALAAGGFVVLNGGDDNDTVTVAGPDATESHVTVPESGALAQQLADGTPVWVVRHDDGSVSVVDAVSTHQPYGAGTLVGWCDSSRGFIDPMYGSMYDEHGRKQAGPAPRGLDEYPVASVDGNTATVTGAPAAQPRAEDGGPEVSEPAGPHCFDTDGDYDPGMFEGTFDSHPITSTAPATPEDALREPDGTLVVVDAPVVVVEGMQPLVCTSEVTGSPPACDGVPAPELLPHDETPVVMRGVFVARPNGGTLTDIAYVGERTVSEADPGAGEASVVREPVLPGSVPDGYRLAWVDTPAVPPSDPDRFPLHERPHDYAYGYQKADTAELEVRVMQGATIGNPQAIADAWNELAEPTTVGGRPAVGYTDDGRHTVLLVDVDGGVAMITTHPLGAGYETPNEKLPSRDVVERFAASITQVGEAEWENALASGADVASTFGPKDGVPVVEGDGWSLMYGDFRAPLSVRHRALWVDFGGATGGAAGSGVLGEDGVWHVAIAVHDGTRVAWGILPAGAETVQMNVGGDVFEVGAVGLSDAFSRAFAVDVSGSSGDATFQAVGATGALVASGPVDVE